MGATGHLDPDRVVVLEEGGLRTIVMIGEHDLHTVEDLRRSVEGLRGDLLVDMREVRLVTSVALRVLVEAGEGARRRAGRAVFVCPQGSYARRVIDLAGARLAVASDLATARAMLAGEA